MKTQHLIQFREGIPEESKEGFLSPVCAQYPQTGRYFNPLLLFGYFGRKEIAQQLGASLHTFSEGTKKGIPPRYLPRILYGQKRAEPQQRIPSKKVAPHKNEANGSA